jgi:DNA-binding SARP family transcriptional activator
MVSALRRGLVRATAAVVLIAITAGLPAALVAFVGWPLPRTLPTPDNLTGWLSSPLSDTVVLNTLAVAAWLLWTAFLPAVAAEALAAHRGLPTPATGGRTGNPLRLGAAALITALTVGALPGTPTTAVVGRAVARPPVAAQRIDTVPAAARLTTSSGGGARAGKRGPATMHVGDSRYSYVVERGDTLSGIAAAWLGDAARWPEICRLNWHRHWPNVGGQLTDCDLIYPGWDLRLPHDATPPSTARPAPPTAGQGHGETSPPSPAPPTSTSTPASPSATSPPTADTPSGPAAAPSSAEAPAPATTPTPYPSSAAGPLAPSGDSSPTTTASTTRRPASGPSTTTPTAARSPNSGDVAGTAPGSRGQRPADRPTSARPSSNSDGITLPGGFLPWTLASALAAALALVWLQRRRRHLPGAIDDDPTDLPEPLLQVAQEVARHPGLPTDPDLAERAAHVPPQAALPPGGIGLTGDGAPAAARAALVSVLSSGGPRDPDRQGEVIIDGSTLTTLIGADAAGLGPWPRLHVADDLEHALALLESRLLHRARLLDEYALTDLDTLREQAPDEEALPPVLLVAETPPPGARMRVKAALTLGADVEITAVLLGAWPHGATVHVAPDGHAHPADSGTDGPVDGPVDGMPGQRLAVLDADTTVAVLATLREAHTGQRPTITTTDSARAPRSSEPDVETPTTASERSPADSPGQAARTHLPDGGVPVTAPATSGRKARLRVFGTPHVDDVTEPGQPLRAKAAELACFLACHPDGAFTRTVSDNLEPTVRLRNADTRVHTYASNLRHVFGRATGPRKIGYVIKNAGRYRLDPTAVDVDLWQLRDLTARAATAPAPERIQLLRQACDLYTAPLADSCAYDWVEPHREKARQQATDAHVLLAEALQETGDPQAASGVLDRAIRHDRYNEDLYRRAMRLRHALGDPDGIRALLHALTVAMADLDAEPDEDTLQLAQRLRTTARTEGAPPRSDHREDGSGSTELLVAVVGLTALIGASLGVIATKVSQRLSAIDGFGHAVPGLIGVLGCLAAGCALARWCLVDHLDHRRAAGWPGARTARRQSRVTRPRQGIRRPEGGCYPPPRAKAGSPRP